MNRKSADTGTRELLWNRRSLLAALLASVTAGARSDGANAAGAAAGSAAQRSARLVDVHHHLFPPAMQGALQPKIPAALLPDVPRSLQEMAAGGVATALLSYPNSDIITLPATRLVPLLRQANDEATRIVQRLPQRYGLFASLPMPYVDESLRELERLYDQLHPDGILLLTSYADRWLGDAFFAPVLAELHRRRAVVFVHPANAVCCNTLLPQLNASVVEYETDTARTIASLMFTGSVDRFAAIRWIFSHGGGTMPSLIERLRTATHSSPRIIGQYARPVDEYLRAFYYDTAQAANPVVVNALLSIVPSTQLLFGTDFPYRHAAEQSDALRAMHLPSQTLEAILSSNARRLFPRLRRAGASGAA